MKNDVVDVSLWHHGVKGQQWGVKHGPPYPIDRDGPITIKKGSSINSVSTDKKISLDNRGIYGFDPSNEIDSSAYRGAYATFLRENRGNKIYEHRFTNSEDLLLPSQKEKVTAFTELYRNDKDFKSSVFNAAISYKQERNKRWGSYVDKWYSEFYGQSPSKTQREYLLFMNRFMTDPSMRGASEKFVSKLSSMGYNAILDDNNANIYNGATAPLYVFSGQQSLTENKRARRLSDSTRVKNFREVMRRQDWNYLL